MPKLSTYAILIIIICVKNNFMKNFSLFSIIDFLFKFAILFAINLIWSLYFIKTAWLSIFSSIIISLLLLLLFWFISRKKQAKLLLSTKESQHLSDTKQSFIYMPQTEVLQFFLMLAKSKHTAVILKNYILINDSTVLIPHIKEKEISIDDVIELYNSVNRQSIKKIIILCNTYNASIETILENFETKTLVLNYNQTYFQLLKEYNIFPPIKQAQNKKTKRTYKQLLGIIFNKKRTRSYVVSSLFIAFSSFFVPYRVYYLIIATILLIFALLCRLNFSFNNAPKENIID